MKRIRTILIANRGEIASRIIRTCRKMGITAVAVYSDADANLPFVREADMAIHIGESEPSKSYLDQEKIIAAAKRAKADAIHPGYGFLSENASFSRLCAGNEIIFIGPNSDAIEAMGSKSQAKSIMEKSGVPVIPGYKGNDQSEETLKAEAEKVGYPLLLKATAGGGGKGMRIVRESSELDSAITAAKREAKNAFGDDELIIEKYIESGRHIEFQILGDQHGNVIHLLERECSIQRRYQKVIEESPSPIMMTELRANMGNAAVLAAKALNYDNAGTVEFIYDENSGEYYFLEVNTRLQVEHPVTEMITGLDLVEMQIQSARGIPLAITQEEVKCEGYAIEARLYAEDASNGFRPATGTVHNFQYPDIEGLRMESAIESGSAISMFYDPMIAKIVVHDKDRHSAHDKLGYVLDHLICQGLTTNQAFLRHLLENENFHSGAYDTHFLEKEIDLKEVNKLEQNEAEELAIAATLFFWQERQNSRKLLRAVPSGWRNSFYERQKEAFSINDEVITIRYRYLDQTFSISINENEYETSIVSANSNSIRLNINGLQRDFHIQSIDNQCFIHSPSIGNHTLIRQERFPIKEKEKVKGGYEAPMPSQIIKIHVAAGDEVKAGDPLLVISSMKMENTLTAEEDGVIEEMFTSEGSNVEAGFLLLKVKSLAKTQSRKGNTH